jgi:hypothetical protein
MAPDERLKRPRCWFERVPGNSRHMIFAGSTLCASVRRVHRTIPCVLALRFLQQNNVCAGQIVEAISIRERPPVIEDRAIPRHWEGDLLSGAKNSHIAPWWNVIRALPLWSRYVTAVTSGGGSRHGFAVTHA